MKNKLRQLQIELGQAFSHLQSGTDPMLVVGRLESIAKKWPDNPDCLHLLAIAQRKAGLFESALTSFEKVVRIQPNNPQILNNLGNLYKDLGELSKATNVYRKAIELEPGFVDALQNLSLVLYKRGRQKESIEHLNRALSIRPSDLKSMIIRANCNRELGHFSEAHSDYKSVLSVDPKHISAWHNRGICFHQESKFEEAKACYEKALEINPAMEESRESLALLFKEQRNLARGIEVLDEGLVFAAQSPTLNALKNEFLWESGANSAFKSNLLSMLSEHSTNLSMVSTALDQLYSARELSLLEDYTTQAIERFGAHPSVSIFKGLLMLEEGNHRSAFDYFESLLKTTESPSIMTEQVKVAIKLGEYQRAQSLIDLLLQKENNNQLYWALQSLIWRNTNPERFDWLMGSFQDIKSYQIERPVGYHTLSAYLQELNQALISKHVTQEQPLTQTLRHGTQTAAKLFDSPEPIFKSYKLALSEIVKDYIESMKDDSEHPLYRRRTGEFRFAGSWSVKLQPDGYHVNHVHPAGWISSSSYIHLPESMTGVDDSNTQGAIKFGESPLGLGDREHIGKLIVPRAGMLVLFPSYTWHGTFAFSGQSHDYRLTAPFDVVPV